MTIFIKLDRLCSVKSGYEGVNFMSEKLCSTDAVEMGMDKQMVTSLCGLGNNAINTSLVSISFSCMDKSSLAT